MNRLFTVIFLFAVSSSFAQIGGSWTQKADVSTQNRESAVGFSINGKGYMGLGIVSGGVNGALWEYNYTTNAWTQKAPMTGGGRVNAVAFVINGYAYVGTGENNLFNLDKKLYQYDPIGNTWTAKTDFGGTARTEAVAFAIGTKGYIGTGFDGVRRKDFWEFDATANTWTQKADFGGTARQRAIGFSIGTKGYIGTGNDGARKKDFWEYDQATNTWTQKKDFAGGARESAVAFVINNKGYIATGDGGTGRNDIWEYSPASDDWSQRANFTGQRRYVAAGFAIAQNGKGYIGTGFTDAPAVGVSTRDFFEFTPAVPPAAPSDLMVTSFSETSIRLNWLDRSSDETGFVVERSTDGTNFTTIATLAAGSAKYTDNGLSTGQQYYYRVRSTKTSDGQSTPTAIASQITGVNHNGVWNTLASNTAANGTPNFENGVTTFTLNNVIYLTGSGQFVGIPDATATQLWSYDPASGVFTQKAQFPGTARTKAVGFALNGKGYVGTGQTNSGSTNSVKDFWQYDPATNAWTQKADVGPVGRFDAFEFTIGNKAYVGAGTISTTGLNAKDFYEYDPVADTWTPKADFPNAMNQLEATGYQNKGYVMYPYTIPCTLYEFDPTGNTWTAKANFPISSYGFRSLNVIKNRLFATTYDFESVSNSTLWEYEMANSRWIERAVHVSGNQYSNANAGNTDDLIYLFHQYALFEYNPDFDLRTPSAIVAEIIDPAKIRITWSLDAAASSAQIYRAESAAGPFTLVTEVAKDKSVYVDELAVGDKVFYYQLRAVNGSLLSAWSLPVKATRRGAWKQLKKMGTNSEMFGDVAVSTSTRGYLGISTFSKTWWEYNPGDDTWTQKASFPGDGRSSASSFSINDQIYVGFGSAFDNATLKYKGFNDFYNYNPANNTWTKKNDFPGMRRTYPTAASGNGKGYILGGDDESGTATSFLKEVWEYSPANDSWLQLTDMPVGAAYFSAFVKDNELHFMNGSVKTSANSWSGTNQWYMLDLSAGTWKKGTATQYGPSGAVHQINGEAYFSVAGMYSYNFTTKRWSIKPGMPGNAYSVRSFMVDGKIYGINSYFEVWVYNPDATVAPPENLNSTLQGDRILLTWTNGSTTPVKTEIQYLNASGSGDYVSLTTTAAGATQFLFTNPRQDDNYRFRALAINENGERSIASNTTFENSGPYWTEISTGPVTARSAATSFIADNKLYYGTGAYGSGYLKDLWEYNLATGAWTQKADFPGEGRSNASTFTLNGTVYVGFGSGASSSSLKDLYKYTPATNTWSSSVNYPNNNGISAPGIFIDGNYAYFLGGQKNGSSSTNELWRFDGMSWTQMTSLPGEIRQNPMVFAMNGKGYVTAGTKYVSGTSSYAGDELWEYTIATDTWKQLKNLPSEVGTMNRSYSFAGSNAALNFVTPNGGTFGLGVQMRVYSPATDSWSKLTNPLTFDFLASAFTAAQDPATGLIYVVLGDPNGVKLWRYEYQLNGPNLVEVKVASPGIARLKWRRIIPQPDSVVIYRSGTVNVLGTRQMAVKSADTTALNSVTAGQTYYYTIRAYSNAGQFKASAQRVLMVDDIPGAPIELMVDLADDKINLTWQVGSGPLPTSYTIERATGPIQNFASIGTSTTTSFSSSDIVAATMSYRVRATNASGESGYSNVVTVVVTAIEEETTVGVYPNPTSDFLIIEIGEQDGPVNMQLLDYNGRQVFGKTLNSTTRLDVSSYAPGIYFVNLMSTKRASNKYIKIIKK